ncbi:AraC-like DNA-binding protein [Actinoplanes lutulentus]|uniref:AraC-like ligand-binding domain-containing protein n=1 Tax=Actinoplanes lutulentus TaxID=1287878 RepID=UPI0015EBF0E9|nr:helix-turn-helix domain-containing protein [Actinoplanes lutulentus]MBB2946484.1 AraC-like DNA-binding protein [Actinoplanes lutulentus]
MARSFGRRFRDQGNETDGTRSGAAFGPLTAYWVSGDPQIARRTPPVGRRPPNRLKLCMQIDGEATVRQNGHPVHILPGQMALYDTRHPYDLRFDRRWSCIVLAFPHGALSLPDNVLRQAMRQAHSFCEGPGAVLADFVAAAMEQRTSVGTSAGRLGEAGLHLIAGALGTTGQDGEEALADAQRLQVLGYIREHLADPVLTHDRVAAVHRMAPRSLHRLFEREPHTVTEYIRMRRLESIHRDLADPMLSHLSIARVASRWCFTSPAHLTRAFQARYGVSPSTVRRTGSPGTS